MPALETPVAPASPSPAPTPTPSPTPAPAAPQPSGSDDPFVRELESKIGGGEPAQKPAALEQKPAADKKPDAKAPVAATKPTAPTPQKESGPKELREEKDRWKAKASDLENKMTEFDKKIADYEARGKDAEALKARLEQVENEYKAAQGELRALKQEASPEFKKQYDEPFSRAADYAAHVVGTLFKADESKADFDKDFVPIYQLAKSNYGRAAAAARELFGDDQAPVVMDQVRELNRLDMTRQRAFEDEKKGWAEKTKAEEGRRVQERDRDTKLWQQTVEDLKNNVEDYRDPVDDTELAEARAKGIEIYEAKPQTKEEHMAKFAHIRHRMGAFGAQQLTIQRMKTRMAELEAQIEEMKTRQPGAEPRKPGGDAVAQPEKSFEDLVASGDWKS